MNSRPTRVTPLPAVPLLAACATEQGVCPTAIGFSKIGHNEWDWGCRSDFKVSTAPSEVVPTHEGDQ